MNDEERQRNHFENHVQANIMSSGIPTPWRKARRFGTWQPATEDKRAAGSAALAFSEGKGPRLFAIVGTPGLGKSHLAAAIAWDYLEDGYSVQYCQVEDLLNQLQAAITDGASFARIWRRLKEADLVILDDLGAQNTTEWRTSQLDALVDYRYREGKALVITSNKVEGIPERIIDRLKEGKTVVMTGPSWRGKRPKGENVNAADT